MIEIIIIIKINDKLLNLHFLLSLSLLCIPESYVYIIIAMICITHMCIKLSSEVIIKE